MDKPNTDDTTEYYKKGLTPFMEERLFKARSVFIFGEINQNLAHHVTEKIIALDAESNAPIRIYLNSPGGHVESGDSIFDIMRYVNSPVQVIGTGWVASIAVLIYLGAKRENRFCLPNTRFLIHQPLGGARGPAVDIGIQAKEILRVRSRLNQLISEHTGTPLEKVSKDVERDFWMSAEEAKAYGIVGQIIDSANALK